jgi:hypothetical protein
LKLLCAVLFIGFSYFPVLTKKLRDFCSKNSDISNIPEIAKRLALKELE